MQQQKITLIIMNFEIYELWALEISFIFEADSWMGITFSFCHSLQQWEHILKYIKLISWNLLWKEVWKQRGIPSSKKTSFFPASLREDLLLKKPNQPNKTNQLQKPKQGLLFSSFSTY